ncbi:MAG: nitronate monooxygenase, partial [Acidimicrobiales bacterium]
MAKQLRELLGNANPIFGFSWWEPDVAIAVSKAGGVGVWGCTRRTPDEIEAGITRMKKELGDPPWGVDLVIPNGMPEDNNRETIEAQLPEEHVRFVDGLRQKYGVPDDGLPGYRSRFVRSEETARAQLNVVMDHQIPVLALGIGSPTW